MKAALFVAATLLAVAVSVCGVHARVTLPSSVAAARALRRSRGTAASSAPSAPTSGLPRMSAAALRELVRTRSDAARGASKHTYNPTTSALKTAALAASTVATAVADADDTPIYGWNTFWYNQTLDHFSFTNEYGTFAQKYLVNDSFWDGTGPIFFYTGNEGPIELFANNTGFMWEVAEEFGALVLFVEHRYYGASRPFGTPASFTPTNLQFLTAEQALADYAEFLSWYRHTNNIDKDIRIVAFGGSYGGMLAAWFRIKYPHIVAGSIAASAPLLSWTDSVSEVFNALVTKDFADTNTTCDAAIRDSWAYMQTLSVADMNKAFTFCPGNYTDKSELETVVFPWISQAWTYMAMADYPYPSSFLGPMPGYPVAYVCNQFFKAGQSKAEQLTAIVQAVGVYFNFSGESGWCYDLYAEPGPSTLADPGGWNYQQCTEMIMPTGQDGVHDFFWPAPWNYTATAEACIATNGYPPRPKWVTTSFGGVYGAPGTDMSADSNIVYSNGLLDPWSGVGILTNLSVASNVVAIQYYGAHHLDLRASNALDPQSVIDARNFHREYIKIFLGIYPSSGLNNAQTAGVTILCTLVGAAVAYYAYNHFNATTAKKAPTDDGSSYPPAALPAAHAKPEHKAPFDSPALEAQSAHDVPQRLSLQQ